MVAPGTQVFTYFNIGHETTRGTPVAPTRQLYSEGTGMFTVDAGLNFHEGENTGRRFRTRRATAQTEDVAWTFKTVSGIGYDDLVFLLSQLKGGLTGVGASADKTWTGTPSATGINAPESYSIDVGDDTQNWRLQYAMASQFKLTSSLGGLTEMEATGFAQRAVKGAKAAPAANTATKIPSELWTIKQAASIATLGAASVIPSWLTDWELEINTGLQWRHYLDGNLFGAQHVETDISWTFTFTVESLAQSVSEFYDKSIAATMSFIRMKAQGPVLGGTFYSAQIDSPVLYDVPEIITAETNGINLYKVTAHGADDGANGIIPVVVNSLAALP
jgi:hypothetical protein